MPTVLTILLICGVLLAPSQPYAQDVYKTEKKSGGVNITRTTYAVSDDWHLTCKTGYTNTSGDYRECTLKEIDGGKLTYRGTYETVDNGLVVTIQTSKRQEQSLGIGGGSKVARRSVARLTVGERQIEKTHEAGTFSPIWSGKDASEIVQLLKRGRTAKFFYKTPSGSGRYQEASLSGFTKAWQFAVEFTGYQAQ